MSDTLLNQSDANFIHDCFRTIFNSNRAFRGFKTCSIIRKNQSAVSSLAGTYRETETILFENVPCDYEHPTEERIANSGGLILPTDIIDFVVYDVGELDTKTVHVHVEEAEWQIIKQHYEEFSGRLELHLRPMKESS